MSPQASAGFVKVPRANAHKSSLGFRGHLITNFPNVMVLLIITHNETFNRNISFFYCSVWVAFTPLTLPCLHNNNRVKSTLDFTLVWAQHLRCLATQM